MPGRAAPWPRYDVSGGVDACLSRRSETFSSQLEGRKNLPIAFYFLE